MSNIELLFQQEMQGWKISLTQQPQTRTSILYQFIAWDHFEN